MGERLNLKDLVGRRQVVVPRYVKQIEERLNNASDENERRILTAYLTAFKYYEEISNMEGDYVKQTMEYLNKEALYLKERFPYVYIEPQGRIKSPISADTKIREKIKEYIEKGRDLNNITNSLRGKIPVLWSSEVGNSNPIRVLDFFTKRLETSICQGSTCHVLYGLHRERGYLTPEIATPNSECSTGSSQ